MWEQIAAGGWRGWGEGGDAVAWVRRKGRAREAVRERGSMGVELRTR